MILELQKEDISILKNSFLNPEEIKKELDYNPYGKILLLLEDKEVIAYLYYSDIYERCELNQIEVIEEKRNCGNAKKLMDYFINKVNKNITLEVRVDNIYAIKLYKHFGFLEKAVRKGYYKGIDGILMERKKDSH